MKFKKLLVVLLAIYLTGCWSDGVVLENDMSENTQTEQSVASEAALPENDSSGESVVRTDISDEDFVKVKAHIPDIVVDLRYATANNFTNQKIYDFTDAWLRYGTVKKLSLVQKELNQKGMSIKIWDGFRPASAQFKLWEVCPNPTYVANPNKGFSSHSRGNTVDITVVGANGKEIVMPTEFDDFSNLADRDYSDCSMEAASNSVMLENLMKKHGFIPYSGEWWHFTDEQSYPVDKTFEPID